MRFEIQSKGDVCILTLEGRFTTGSDDEYLRAKEALHNSGQRKVILDCRDVPYMDSTALNFVVGLYSTVSNLGGKFMLAGINARVREVLRVTHLDGIIEIFDGCDSALAAMAVES